MPRAITKPKASALVDIQTQLAAELEHIQDQIGKPSGNKIKVKDKTFSLPNGVLTEGPLTVTIVDFVSRNKYYGGKKFDPKNPTPPICFAVGKTLRDMKPSTSSPQPQANECSSCPLNQFGSDGRGKACKNTRYLAVIEPENIDPAADLMVIEVSPTAIQRFDATVNAIANLYGKVPLQVSVDLDFDQKVDYDSLTFTNPQELTDELVEVHFQRRQAAESILLAEPDFLPTPEPAPAPRRATRRTA